MFEELVGRWGYAAISLGTYVEGEAVLLSVGALAHAGVFSLPLVVLAATIGSAAWGQTWFHIGRVSGRSLVTRRPKWTARATVVEQWLSRWGFLVLLFGRFMVGMGTLLPVLVGASGFPRWRFCVLDCVGALIWAGVVACVGFGIGAGLTHVVGHSVSWLWLAAAGISTVGAFWLSTLLYARAARRRP